MDKRIFVVLGMARSGTSAIAKALEVLGVDLGNKLLSARGVNPKGFYEDTEIMYDINRRVVDVLGNPWISSDSFIVHPALQPYKNKAIILLNQRFSNTSCWGFKDPRTVGMLHFWQNIFCEMQLDDNYVITMRHPLSSAYSNFHYMRTDIEVGLIQWMTSLISAIDNTNGKKRVLVSYELMLENPKNQLERMHQQLSLDAALSHAKANEYTNHFLDKSLRHHAFDETELDSKPVIQFAPLCSSMYTLLLKVAKDEMTLDSEAFQAEWKNIRNEFFSVYPVFLYVKKILAHRKLLQREIRLVHKSLLWKLLNPLRQLTNILKRKRQFNGA